jgi:hypothetical protein
MEAFKGTAKVKFSKEIKVFLQPLAAWQRLLSRIKYPGIIIGGIAASLLAVPRFTADIDALIIFPLEKLQKLIELAEKEGFIARIPKALDFARCNRVLLLRHQASGINLDLALGCLPFETEAIKRRIEFKIGEIAIDLPSPEDLIVLKSVAHRPKDLFDIQAIIKTHPHLNQRYIKKWVRQFAKLLEMPELWDDIVKLLSTTA